MRDPMPFLFARFAEGDVVIYDLVVREQTSPLEEVPTPARSALGITDHSDHSAGDSRPDGHHEPARSIRARFEPRRLELDLESRQRIAYEHQESGDSSCATCRVEYPCPTLRCLTRIYAGHSAYDPQWDDSNPEADAWVVAREQLDWIDGARSIAELLGQEIPEAEIASRLGLSSSRVRHASAYLHTLGGVFPESPEEIIARCVVTRGDREAMVERLKTWPYTFGSQAEHPFEGGTTSAWDDIEEARFDGLLAPDEYDAIRAAVEARGGWPQ